MHVIPFSSPEPSEYLPVAHATHPESEMLLPHKFVCVFHVPPPSEPGGHWHDDSLLSTHKLTMDAATPVIESDA